MRNPRGLVGLVAVCCWQSCYAQDAMWTPRKIYVDSSHGVRFEYPASWGRNRKESIDTPNLLNTTAFKPMVFFAGKGQGRFAKTNLEAAYFAYALAPASDEANCQDLVTKSVSGNGKSYTTPINGRTFFVINSGEGSAGHGFSGDVYATFAAGKCYAFEVGEGIVSEGLVDRLRGLNRADFKVLDLQLMELMKTVRIR